MVKLLVLLPLLLVALMVYFLPLLIATQRGHRNLAPIGLTNLFFGWTLMGWLITLIWAFSDNTERSNPRAKK